MKIAFFPVIPGLALFSFSAAGQPFTQEYIEVYSYHMAGWGKPKASTSRIRIVDGMAYKVKKENLTRIGNCDTLNALLDHAIIDSLFRGEEKQCEDGYETNIVLEYHKLVENVETTYKYQYSMQCDCLNATTSDYLRRIKEEVQVVKSRKK